MDYLKLEDLCIDIIDCPHITPVWLNSGIPIIRNYNLKNGILDTTNLSYVDEDTYIKRTRRATPEYGDIIISREAPMGVVCMVPQNFKCCLGQRLVLLKINKKLISPDVVLYALQSDYVQQQIRAIDKSGSIVSNLNIPTLKQLTIPIRNTFLNESIELLSLLDLKIINCKSMIEKIINQTQSLYTYWFLQKKSFNESLNENIIWKKIKLGDIFDFVKGKTPEYIFKDKRENSMEYLNMESLGNSSHQYCNPSGLIESKGEVLMVVDGTAGNIFIGRKGIVGSTVCKLLIKDSHFKNSFLFIVLYLLEEEFKKKNTGSTVPHVNKNIINNFEIDIPLDDNVFTEMQECIESSVGLMINQEETLSILIDLKMNLLELIMNGQINFK